MVSSINPRIPATSSSVDSHNNVSFTRIFNTTGTILKIGIIFSAFQLPLALAQGTSADGASPNFGLQTSIITAISCGILFAGVAYLQQHNLSSRNAAIAHRDATENDGVSNALEASGSLLTLGISVFNFGIDCLKTLSGLGASAFFLISGARACQNFSETNDADDEIVQRENYDRNLSTIATGLFIGMLGGAGCALYFWKNT